MLSFCTYPSSWCQQDPTKGLSCSVSHPFKVSSLPSAACTPFCRLCCRTLATPQEESTHQILACAESLLQQAQANQDSCLSSATVHTHLRGLLQDVWRSRRRVSGAQDSLLSPAGWTTFSSRCFRMPAFSMRGVWMSWL